MAHYTTVPTSIPMLPGPPYGTTVTGVYEDSDCYAPSDKPLSARSRLVRLFLFLVLELGYIALAVICYRKPLLLPSFLTSSENKGILTILLIVWQTLAITPVSGLVIQVFSGEWSVQLSKTGQLVPGMTDSVSTLNAGLADQVAHLWAGLASRSFWVAFLASLVFRSLAGLAPGTFSISYVFLDEPLTLPIGNFTIVPSDAIDQYGGRMVFPVQRAELIARLEQIENNTFGYDVQPNWVVGWPPLEVSGVNGTVEYPSDGVRFQYECTWKAPVAQWSDGDIIWVTEQSSWALWISPTPGMVTPYTNPPNAVLLPLIDIQEYSDTFTSRSAYLFWGSNSTLQQTNPDGSRASEIDLSGIPSTYNASGFLVGKVNRSDPTFYAPPLASVLECDPRISISSVTVVRGTDHTLRISNSSSSERIGNIPEGAANMLFSQSLLSATSTPEPYGDTSTIVNYFAASLFMTDPTMSSDSSPIGTAPLDLAAINAKVDAYTLSSSKAYAAGYQPMDDSLPIGNFTTVPVNGTVQVQRLALVTSKPLMITTVVVVGVSAVILAMMIPGEERQPFSLGNIMKEMRKRRIGY